MNSAIILQLQIQKLSKGLGALTGKTATEILEARSLVGTISFQLLLVDTWKALMIHPQIPLRKRMEGTIHF
jgi:hypothetical protein